MLSRLSDTLMLAKIRFDDDNPMNGLSPSYDFGSDANALWKKLLAAVWGLAILATIVWCIIAAVKMGNAKENDRDHAAGKKGLTHALIALGAVVGMPIIVGAIIYLAQS